MKTRIRLAAVLLAAACATAAWAGPPKDAEEFATSEVELRWAAWRASPDPVAEWVGFLSARKDWEMLEWIALTTRTSEALRALEEADAPPWIRCALWRLEGSDSHADEEATALLLGRRGETVLAYLERHADAVGGKARSLRAQLREKVRAGADATRFLPPWKVESLLSLLEPPAAVEDEVPPTGATPGFVYAQQVERALLAWARTGLRLPPWPERIAALLKHGVPAVRRAAALACANLSTTAVPAAALAALLRSEKEPAAVRAAAAIGYSFSAEPEVLLKLLHVAQDAKHPAWTAAVSRLGDLGDEFVAERLAKAKPEGLSEPAEALRLDVVKRIRERLAAEDAGGFAARLPSVLRRAAWADTHCDPFEVDLVPFAIDHAKARAGDPAVRQVLEGLRTPTAGDDLSERVAEYARSALTGAAGNAK